MAQFALLTFSPKKRPLRCVVWVLRNVWLVTLMLILISVLGLSGCGKKGPLTLPEGSQKSVDAENPKSASALYTLNTAVTPMRQASQTTQQETP
ncbi:MAG: lipoprotein [Thiotrichales bacterium]|nr:lipoprotein [Thiotrichales bacterium]